MKAWAAKAPLLLLLRAIALGGAPETAAVLPFGNAAPGAPASTGNLDWIGESIAETLRDALTTHGVVTPDRDEIQKAYRGLNLRARAVLTAASVMKIGEAADAEQVIFGRFEFRPSGAEVQKFSESRGSLRIFGRVLNRRKMKQSSEFEESGALDDLPALEAHLAWRVLGIVAEDEAPPETEFRSLRPAIRLEAEESYIRGLMAGSPEQREKYFMQAARLDAHFAHPCYQLGLIHYQRKEYQQAEEWLQKVGAGDIDYHRASFLLGLALFQSGDYAGAQKAFQTVAAAAPLSEVFNNLGAAESRRNLPQALADFRKALEGDPNDPVYRFNTGYALYKKGDLAGAAEQFRAVLDRNPEDPMATLLLGRCLKKQGLKADANSGGARFQNQERLKTAFEERAYLQLKSLLDRKAAGAGAPEK
ncbi:MAG TPA: tetratricopeptide repeat protein [Bryobacteraceae bacterium]|nr:tetratricopeptide repeat protein [Bryobacteraceae bacterium]